MSIRLAKVADESFLKIVWKRDVRPALRSMTFSNFILASDPLHYAGYEWGLETLISALAKEISQGRYTPERGEIVRMAKGKGLSRPLCFLATRDALVYSAITKLIRGELIADAQPWVGFDRSDKGSSKPADGESNQASDSIDWFRVWLTRQGYVAHLVDDEQVLYIVESDIANFYPSIRLEAVREHLHSQTTLEKEVVRLCIQILDGVMPRRDYSEVSLMGLPQEQIGSSREIAHSLLLHVDEEFQAEGELNRYTRFMDDILIGVDSIERGEACISRLQRSLETIGLYPNAAKTIVTPVDEYLRQAMVETNGEVDRITNELERLSIGEPRVIEAPDELKEQIEILSNKHRELKGTAKRWGRVTRRIYTLHRAVGLRAWWEFWPSDIENDPGATQSILEYVRAWPLDITTVGKLTSLSRRYSELYPNISLLAAETLSSAPISSDAQLWNQAYNECRLEFRRLVGLISSAPDSERLAASWLLAAWKFANASQEHSLLDSIPRNIDSISPIRAQALPLLVKTNGSLEEWVSAKPGLRWENALAAEYLRSLNSGGDRAVGVALSLIEPQLRLAPQRFVSLPRAIPLIDIVGHSSPTKLSKVARPYLRRLQKNPERLRDCRVESIIANWLS